MNKTSQHCAVLVLALAAGLAPTFVAHAEASPWLVRVRAIDLKSDNGGSTTPNLDLSINDRIIPEVDISYFLTPQLALELVLTYPQKHDIRSAGSTIGSVKHLPPTLSFQYHFTGLGAIKPYVGAGLNLTLFSGVSFDPAVESALHPSLSSNSVGLALGAGADWEIGKGLFLNVDVKKVQIRTDVKSSGTKIGDLKIDPLLVGVGLGWRF
jgi:outer membrane protein